MGKLWVLLTCAFLAVPAAHVLVSPYTKVEESFTLHAVHDVLRYGFKPATLSQWDHRTFPGAVPRSFVPAILLGMLSWPVAVLGVSVGYIDNLMKVQILIRLILAGGLAFSYIHLSRTLWAKYSRQIAVWFAILSLTQFHIPYYAGRTLPNFTALPFVVFAVSIILRGRYWAGIALMTAVATVVRLEIALLVVPTAINLAVQGYLSFYDALVAGVVGGFGSLAIAAPIDYALWSPTLPHPSLPTFEAWHTVWPELGAMIFNIVGGHADEWGVMPKNFYLVYLVKMLLVAFPLFIAGLLWMTSAAFGLGRGTIFENATVERSVSEVVRIFLPGVYVMIAALSMVGHKEWRFIVYVVPIFNIIAACAASGLWQCRHRLLRLMLRLGIIGMLALTTIFTVFSTWVSTHNYPGGALPGVLEALNVRENSTIHFTHYPLQTGTTLFTFDHADLPASAALPPRATPMWVYSKSEDPALANPVEAWDREIEFIVTHDWPTFEKFTTRQGVPLYHLVAAVDGLDGFVRGTKNLVQIRTSPKLAVLQRL